MGHSQIKKKLWATSGLLISNTPPTPLLRYAHRRLDCDVFLDHFVEVIRHGNYVASLFSEKLELLAKRLRDVSFDLGGTFLSHVTQPCAYEKDRADAERG